ncbi:DUF5682 family protein [uncultured Nocardioides sp.]|uniref:DUF5682 family protein n=1 Tax=uncultured Nocardioides sp. TaxID=198441 RepID=UPI0025DD1F67|nr:DUF5682 family protein [uncultured Nocardioides sp.]
MTSSDDAADAADAAVAAPRIEVLGVRHHGPGSARSVLGALEELAPDAVVIEGAPELDVLVETAVDPGLVPPVAALVYAADAPRRASFYPLASFSPEWVALRWARARDVPVRFADLPAAHTLGERDDDVRAPHRPDPIGTLARAAGYDDPERWWEDAVEHRTTSSLGTFVAIREAMAEVRADLHDEDLENDRREAAMRRVLRAVLKGGARRVAFVCGAFHAPAVHPDAWPPATRDTRLLAGLPRTKVATTWVPWSAGRLAFASGYGAGVTSPGWYQHLFASWERGDDVVAGWLTRTARELRAEGIDAAPASVVEAVRIADALAAVRGRPSVGLSELVDATQTVLCGGSELPLALVRERLVIGQELGRVPASVPLTPLAQDLARQQRTLRLKPTATATTITLDLRKDSQRDRSVLLHRLRLLEVPWGTETDAGRSTGTFKEAWELRWEPELSVALIEAGLHGTTVLAAAESKVAETAERAPDLAVLGALVGECLTADLPGALAAVVDTLAERTARQHDTLALLRSVEPLARTRRYGDVRGADTARVAGVLETVVTRASVGLRPACSSLDDEAASAMREAIDGAHRGVALVDDATLTEPWRGALAAVAADDRINGAVAGRANRLLLDAGVLEPAETARRLARRLSPGAGAVAGAAWLDGFLQGDALLLLHDRELLRIVDEWVASVGDEVFEDLLPLLRRTFSRFDTGARRQIGTRLRQPDRPLAVASTALDLERGLPAALRVAELLGLRGGKAS